MIDDMLKRYDKLDAQRAARSVKRAEDRDARKKRGIVITFVIVFVFALFIITMESFIYNAKIDVIRSMPTEIVTVASGDCLESIAAKCGITGISTTYLADILDEMNEDTLAETNGVLYPGMKLRIPVPVND